MCISDDKISLNITSLHQCCHLFDKYLKITVADSVINILENYDILHNKN